MSDSVGQDDPNAPKCPVCKKPVHARKLVYKGNNKRGNITAKLCAKKALNYPDKSKHFFIEDLFKMVL